MALNSRAPRCTPLRDGNRIAIAAVVLLLAAAGLIPPYSAAHATTAEGINIPVATNFCGQSSVVVEFTICNDSEVETTHHLSFTAGVEVYGCGESVIPAHTFLDDPHPTLAPGACTTIRAEIERPVELSSNPSVCYWIRIDVEPGAAYFVGATLLDQIPHCFDWYFEEWAPFIHPEDPVTFEVDIFNGSTQPVEFLALFEVWGLDGDTGQDVIALNGLEPGTSVLETIDLAEGAMTTLSVDVEWLNASVFGFYNLVVVREDTFEPIASIGIGHRPQAPVSVEGEASPDGPRDTVLNHVVSIQAVPNPSARSSSLRFELSTPVSNATASVVDASGRHVRTLFQARELSAGMLRVDWDGSDDRGTRVPAGVYWVRLASGQGVQKTKLVRVD